MERHDSTVSPTDTSRPQHSITPSRLVLRSLRFYWRNHLAVALGAALATAVLTGALLVGDSVRFSLERLALLRLGKTDRVISSPMRFFRAALADDLHAVPVLMLRGVVSTGDGKARVNHAQIVGVDERFWSLGEHGGMPPKFSVNRRLAVQLGLKAARPVVVRVEKPSWLPRDAPLGSDKDVTVAERVEIGGVVSDEQMGRFSLQANQISPATVFVPLAWLQKLVEQTGRANVLLAGPGVTDDALRKNWKLADAELELRELPNQRGFELRTDRVFLDPPMAEAILKATPQAQKIFTYFVNELRKGDRATPYSMVAAMEQGGMRDDQIIINSWLAEDLYAAKGDTIQLAYFVVGSGRTLEERTTSFRVNRLVSLDDQTADPDLMPKYPGLEDKENCRDWEPGIPIQLNRIRDRDEAYWHKYRGTPKAFISLGAGQRLWSNRFGNLTALRYPAAGNTRESIERAIHDAIEPATVGLVFQPERDQALRASREAQDFGQLFLGFSIFLIVAALLLMGLLFAFGIQQRTEEIGTLLAVGLPPRLVRRLLLAEGLALALCGGMAGTLAGVAYTKAALWGLTTVWSKAVAGSEIYYHAEPATPLTGGAAGVIVAWLVIWIGVRRQAKKPARVLLSRDDKPSGVDTARNWGLWIGLLAGLGALAIALSAGARRDVAEIFFGAGALMLVAGFGFSQAALRAMGSVHLGVAALGLRNLARRWGRSLATIGLLACGSFLVIAVGANRPDPAAQTGTGGFTLYGETTVSVYQDLNTRAARESFGLPTNGFAVVGLRVHDGDDASCLNLNRAHTPRLLGVAPKSFTFGTGLAELLEGPLSDGVVPAIGDEATVHWALGKKVGDTVAYTDERGRNFPVRIVAMMPNSILQGSLVIAEKNFAERFPSEGGQRVLLIETQPQNATELTAKLSLALRDFGLEVRPASDRLADFNAVENTYLSIFQVIGGLGLLLGSVGLGIVVLRNVLERRSELAILRAVGFSRARLRWMIVSEHWMLLTLGLGCGVVAAVLAVLPSLRAPGAPVPYTSLAVTLLVIVASGLSWVWLAARAALRGPLMKSLRNE